MGWFSKVIFLTFLYVTNIGIKIKTGNRNPPEVQRTWRAFDDFCEFNNSVVLLLELGVSSLNVAGKCRLTNTSVGIGYVDGVLTNPLWL